MIMNDKWTRNNNIKIINNKSESKYILVIVEEFLEDSCRWLVVDKIIDVALGVEKLISSYISLFSDYYNLKQEILVWNWWHKI